MVKDCILACKISRAGWSPSIIRSRALYFSIEGSKPSPNQLLHSILLARQFSLRELSVSVQVQLAFNREQSLFAHYISCGSLCLLLHASDILSLIYNVYRHSASSCYVVLSKNKLFCTEFPFILLDIP